MLPTYKFICIACRYECLGSIGREVFPQYSNVVMVCRACADISTYKKPNRVGIDDYYDHDLVCKNCHTSKDLQEWDGISCPHCQKPMRATGANIRAHKPQRYY